MFCAIIASLTVVCWEFYNTLKYASSCAGPDSTPRHSDSRALTPIGFFMLCTMGGVPGERAPKPDKVEGGHSTPNDFRNASAGRASYGIVAALAFSIGRWAPASLRCQHLGAGRGLARAPAVQQQAAGGGRLAVGRRSSSRQAAPAARLRRRPARNSTPALQSASNKAPPSQVGMSAPPSELSPAPGQVHIDQRWQPRLGPRVAGHCQHWHRCRRASKC